MANAASGRQALILVGVRDVELTGVYDAPTEEWWTSVESAFPGAIPDLDWAMVDAGDVDILVIAIGQPGELVTGTRRGGAFVPWFDGRRIVDAPVPTPRESPTRGERVPEVAVLGGWIERSCLGRPAPPVDVYRGVVDMELEATAGAMNDDACSATLLVDELDGAIGLDVQVHPLGHDAGVIRTPAGVVVRSTFRIRAYVAAATPASGPGARGTGASAAQLVLSLPLPGRSVPELRSLLLSPDAGAGPGTRWTF